MFRLLETRSGVDWLAVGPHGVILLSNGELNQPLENLDLKKQLLDADKEIEMIQLGANLLFQEYRGTFGNALIYSLKTSEVIFSTTDKPEYYEAGFGDLSAAGYILVELRHQRKFKSSLLIDSSSGCLLEEFDRRVMTSSDGGKYIYSYPIGGGNITRLGFNGNALWELVADNHEIQRTGSEGTFSNKVGNIVGERNGLLWYQETSGVVKAADIDTGHFEMKIGPEESDLPSGKIQVKGEQLHGTYNYRFSKDKQIMYGMGGSLYTEIDLNSDKPRRRVFNCSDSTREYGTSFFPVGPSYPEIDNHLIFCDSRSGFLGALDRESKRVTWSIDLFPEGAPRSGIREVVEHENMLYVLADSDSPAIGSKLITLERT